MKRYIIACDQGTTSSRTIIFDKKAHIVESAAQEITQVYPHPGWVEQDPMEILSTQVRSFETCLKKSGIPHEEIAGIGITNQRETTVVWNKDTGKPVYNAIVWQCRRTAEMIEELRKDATFEAYVKTNTGLVLDAYFSATKIKWILDNVPGAREQAEQGTLLFGTTDSWLIWNLSNRSLHITDYTNASRTLLFNIKTKEWDPFLLDRFSIPRKMLPEVRHSSEVYGKISVQNTPFLVAGIAGDQQSALFGQRCTHRGDVKNTYGTGCFILMNTGEDCIHSRHGLITTLAATQNSAQYVLEGSVFVAGAVIQWLRDGLELINSAQETEAIARSVDTSNGVVCVPAFVGLGSPHWDMFARGTFFGLTRGTTKAHIVRAALESIALQSNDLLRALEQDIGESIPALKVDGGASLNDFLMQFQADVGNREIVRPQVHETTALGAAFLAGLALSFFEDEAEIDAIWEASATFHPNMEADTRDQIIENWNKAIERSKQWITPQK